MVSKYFSNVPIIEVAGGQELIFVIACLPYGIMFESSVEHNDAVGDPSRNSIACWFAQNRQLVTVPSCITAESFAIRDWLVQHGYDVDCIVMGSPR